MSTSTRFDSSYTQVSVFAGSAQIHCATDAFCKKSSPGSVDGIYSIVACSLMPQQDFIYSHRLD